jgi:hypothetical protein
MFYLFHFWQYARGENTNQAMTRVLGVVLPPSPIAPLRTPAVMSGMMARTGSRVGTRASAR